MNRQQIDKEKEYQRLRIKQIVTKNVFQLLVIVVTLITMILALYYQFVKVKDDKREAMIQELDSKKVMLEYENAIQRLQLNTDSLLKHYLFTDSIRLIGNLNAKDVDIVNLKIKTLEDNLNKQSEVTMSLRQAINPLKPDEVLTIARLKDQIDQLNKDLKTLEENQKVRQQNFEESIKRETSSSNQSTTLILVVLIPLVLNFLYTVWKDFKKPDKEKAAKETTDSN